jgi:HSP20 family molecular chaperone IbpA
MSSHRIVTSSVGSDPFFDGFGGSPSQSEIHCNEWKTEVDVTGFEPGDIKVSVDGESIIVHCLHDEGGSRRETRRQLQAPDGTDTTKLESELKDAGVLVVKAPYEAPKGIKSNNNNDPFPAFGGFSKMSAGLQSRVRGLDKDDDGKDFLTKVVLRNFQPSEIEINAGGGRITVKAHSQKGVSTRMVDRSFDLPSNVDMASLAAILTEDGTMYIGDPVPDNIKGQSIEITKQ